MGVGGQSGVFAGDYKGYIDKRFDELNKELQKKLAEIEDKVNQANNNVSDLSDLFVKSETAPENLNAIWFDTRQVTNTAPMIKYYDSKTKTWIPFGSALV